MIQRNGIAPFALLIAIASHQAIVRADATREVIVRGKQATALVDGGEKGSGSAFCINAAGVYITNEHVVKNAESDGHVMLVLRTSADDETKMRAAVVHRDPKLDLAMLRAAPSDKHEALTLGGVDELFETQSVIAFGYPFGKSLALDKGAYPSISVNSGRITSLRKREGELEAIQVDAELNPCSSHSRS